MQQVKNGDRTTAGVSFPLRKYDPKKATGDCVVLRTQLMAGSQKTETVVTSHPSLLKAFVDGEMGTFDSFMIDFSLANQE